MAGAEQHVAYQRASRGSRRGCTELGCVDRFALRAAQDLPF